MDEEKLTLTEPEVVSNSDYADRLAVLEKYIGDIFTRPYTVLYIGAKKSRWDYVPEMYNAGAKITVLEAYEENAEGLKESSYFERVIHGDVRYINYLDLGRDKFDVVFWWHGPEHVSKAEAKELVPKLVNLANKYVVLGVPWGVVPQGVVKGNMYEVHLSSWDIQDFIDIDFNVEAIEPKDVMGSCLVGWMKK